MEWAAPGRHVHSATFDDALDGARAGQRLRTALSLDGEWLPAVLRRPTSGSGGPRACSPTPAGS